MTHHEHHFRNLQRSRDGLTNTIVSLQSAAERMTGDDWLDAVELLAEIETNIGPRLARLRKRASDRFDEWAARLDFDLMCNGEKLFPDERRAVSSTPGQLPTLAHAKPRPMGGASVFPNARVGARLIKLHGGVDEAMKAYQPDSVEFDHIQAYRYVSTGKRPIGWVPPIVGGGHHG
jgi:hypothetical protein